MTLLSQIHGPDDVKKLSLEECGALATEIRQTIIDTVSRQGGHLASNLGDVELTIALHRAFHSPTDKILFDVGHQIYAHKLSPVEQKLKVTQSCPTLHQNTGVGSLSILHGIFPTQESNWGLLHCRRILYQLSYVEQRAWQMQLLVKPLNSLCSAALLSPVSCLDATNYISHSWCRKGWRPQETNLYRNLSSSGM